MLAAETTFDALSNGLDRLETHAQRFKDSWLYRELYQSRNFGAAMHRFGPWIGAAWNYIEQNIFSGKLPITLKDNKADHSALKTAAASRVIDYPGYDGEISFDKTASVYLSNTNHEEDQPCHLQLSDSESPMALSWPVYAGPEARFCPAGVYEYLDEEDGIEFRINAQNCVHCKTCDIKDYNQNITWVSPEAGGGPQYASM